MEAAAEADLADLHKILKSKRKELLQLQLEFPQLQEDLKELETRKAKLEAELLSTQAQLKKKEALINSKGAAFSNYVWEKDYLETEVHDLKGQVAKLEWFSAKEEKQLEEETLKQRDAETRVQALEVELDVLRNTHSKELREMEDRYKRRLEELKNSCLQKFQRKLPDQLQKIGSQNEAWKKLCRNQLQDQYEAKMAAKKVILQNLEVFLAKQRDTTSRILAEMDREMAKMRASLQQLQQENEETETTNRAMEAKISTSRSHLEGQGERLPLSPSPLVQRSGSRISGSASAESPTKRRKLEDGESHTSFSQHAQTSASVAMEEGKLKEEVAMQKLESLVVKEEDEEGDEDGAQGHHQEGPSK